jgi:NOL1/NOP2/fmu family ribosome biogenesis protein
MFIGELFRQLAGEGNNLRVLDLCAAPGGKSTHLSSIIGKRGVLIANEVIKSRASVLAENISKWGISNTIVTSSDPSAFRNLCDYFDVILVDAPCSGEGMFRDFVAVKEWSVSKSAMCAERQKRILTDIWPSLKENGLLIYSTCTFNPAENEENVAWLREKFVSVSLEADISGFQGIKEIEFKGARGYGFHPGKIKGEGFFVSALRKTGDTGKPGGKVRTRKIYDPLSAEDRRIIPKWINIETGSVIKDAQSLFHLPLGIEEFTNLESVLKVTRRGTGILTRKGKDTIPFHDLILSDILKPVTFEIVELNLNQARKFLRCEIPDLSGIPEGIFIAAFRGIRLGLMRNIGKRMNNYYPRNLRIRMAESEFKEEDIITWNHN